MTAQPKEKNMKKPRRELKTLDRGVSSPLNSSTSASQDWAVYTAEILTAAHEKTREVQAEEAARKLEEQEFDEPPMSEEEDKHIRTRTAEVEWKKNTSINQFLNQENYLQFRVIKREFYEHEIKAMVDIRLSTVTMEEIHRMGYPKGITSGGWYFPFNPERTFGQVRPDVDYIDDEGKVCKYLSPIDSKSDVFLPAGAAWVTEGFVDGMYANFRGGVLFGIMAGVSHYKALQEGCGVSFLFDSDGWHNPDVFRNLVKAALHTKGRIQLLPVVTEVGKDGCEEYFKSDKTAEEFQELLDNAYAPKDFLKELPNRWARAKSLTRNIQVYGELARLPEIQLSPAESKELLAGLISKFASPQLRAAQIKSIYSGSGTPIDRAEDAQQLEERRRELFASRASQFQELIAYLVMSLELRPDNKPFRADDAHTLYQGFAPGLPVARTLLLQGGMGSGKTEAIVRYTKERVEQLDSDLDANDHRRFMDVGTTNNLMRGMVHRHKAAGIPRVYFYQDDVVTAQNEMRSGGTTITAMAVDSLKQHVLSCGDLSKTTLIVDEAEEVLDKIHNGEMESERQTFHQALELAPEVIVADARLSRTTYEHLKKYRSGGFHIMEQEKVKANKNITILRPLNRDGAPYLTTDAGVLPTIDEWLAEGKRFVVACDSKMDAMAVNNYLLGKGIHSVLSTADTVELNKRAMSDPTAFLEKEKPQVFIYSPVMASGVNIQYDGFDCGLLIYNGIISPKGGLQMLGRCRKVNDWSVLASRNTFHGEDSRPKSLKPEDIKRAVDAEIQAAAVQGRPAPDRRHLEYIKRREAEKSIEKAFSAEYLEYLLREDYANVRVQEIAGSRAGELTKLRDAAKYHNKELDLQSNAVRGQQLMDSKSQPDTDSDVPAVRMAIQLKHGLPKTNKRLMDELREAGTEERRKEVVELALAVDIKKIAGLKNRRWVARPNAREELKERITDMQQSPHFSPNNRQYQKWCKMVIYLGLELERFATLQNESELTKDNSFTVESRPVRHLFNKFIDDEWLSSLFPEVTDIDEFWSLVGRIMTTMGHKSCSKPIRVETPGELHANGNHRNGRERFSESKTVRIKAWVVIEKSGSSIYQEMYELIAEEIDEKIEQDQQEYSDRKAGRGENNIVDFSRPEEWRPNLPKRTPEQEKRAKEMLMPMSIPLDLRRINKAAPLAT